MKPRLPFVQLFLLTVLMIATGVIYYFTDKNIKEISSLQSEVSTKQLNVNKLADISSTLPTLSADMSNFQSTLPQNEADVAKFAATAEQAAKAANMTITFHFDDFPKTVNVSGQNIYGLGSDITLEGSYQGLTTFVTQLSSLPYFFKIDKMTLVKHETKTGLKATLNGQLMMNIKKP